MGREQKILLLENRKPVRLYLTAMVRSINSDISVVSTSRIEEAKKLVRKYGAAPLTIIGLENFSDARKVEFLKFLRKEAPETVALLVYDKKKPSGEVSKTMRSLGSGGKRFLSCSLELDDCRAVLSEVLSSGKESGRLPK